MAGAEKLAAEDNSVLHLSSKDSSVFFKPQLSYFERRLKPFDNSVRILLMIRWPFIVLNVMYFNRSLKGGKALY